jgi:hypothetical protein
MKINLLYIEYWIEISKIKWFHWSKRKQLKEHIISSCLAFPQIYKLYGYGQYKMHGSVINVPIDVNQTQSILPCLPHDDATIG